jgi:hypothetical protein
LRRPMDASTHFPTPPAAPPAPHAPTKLHLRPPPLPSRPFLYPFCALFFSRRQPHGAAAAHGGDAWRPRCLPRRADGPPPRDGAGEAGHQLAAHPLQRGPPAPRGGAAQRAGAPAVRGRHQNGRAELCGRCGPPSPPPPLPPSRPPLPRRLHAASAPAPRACRSTHFSRRRLAARPARAPQLSRRPPPAAALRPSRAHCPFSQAAMAVRTASFVAPARAPPLSFHRAFCSTPPSPRASHPKHSLTLLRALPFCSGGAVQGGQGEGRCVRPPSSCPARPPRSFQRACRSTPPSPRASLKKTPPDAFTALPPSPALPFCRAGRQHGGGFEGQARCTGTGAAPPPHSEGAGGH